MLDKDKLTIMNNLLGEGSKILSEPDIIKCIFTLKVSFAQNPALKTQKTGFDINRIINICHRFTKEEIGAKKNTMTRYRNRLALIVKLIKENDHFINDLTSESFIKIILNAHHKDSFEFIEYILTKDKNILDNHMQSLSDYSLLRKFTHTYNETYENETQFSLNAINCHKFYEQLYNLLKDIKASVKSDEPITDKIKQQEIIVKLCMGYFLCLNMALRSRFAINDVNNNEGAKESIRGSVFPFLNIIIHLINRVKKPEKFNATLLSQKTILSLHGNYHRSEPLAYALIQQFYQLAACYANYSTFDLNFVDTFKSTTENENNEYHTLTIKSKKRTDQYFAPMKRIPVTMSYTRHKITDTKFHYNIQESMQNTYNAVIVNRYFIACTLSGTAYDHWSTLNFSGFRSQPEDLPTYSDDSIEALVAALRISKHTAYLYRQASPTDVSKLELAKIQLLDPTFLYLFHNAISFIAATINDDAIGEQGWQLMNLLDILNNNSDFEFDYDSGCIDYANQPLLNIIDTEWSENITNLFFKIFKDLFSNNGKETVIANFNNLNEKTLEKLTLLVEQYCEYRGMITKSMLTWIPYTRIDEDLDDIHITIQKNNDYQLFKSALDNTLQKYIEYASTNTLKPSIYDSTKTIVFHDFRNKKYKRFFDDLEANFKDMKKQMLESKKKESEPLHTHTNLLKNTIVQLTPVSSILIPESKDNPASKSDEESSLLKNTHRTTQNRNKLTESTNSEVSIDQKRLIKDKLAQKQLEREMKRKEKQEKKRKSHKQDNNKNMIVSDVSQQSQNTIQPEVVNNSQPPAEPKTLSSPAIKVVVYNANFYPLKHEMASVEPPLSLGLSNCHHHYCQIRQLYNDCVDTNKDDVNFNDQSAKTFAYYNALRIAQFMSNANLATTRNLATLNKNIRHILAHRSDVILHDDQYNKEFFSPSHKSIVYLVCRIYTLCVDREENAKHTTELDLEEKRIIEALEENRLYSNLLPSIMVVTDQPIMTSYKDEDFTSNLDLLHGLLNTKDYHQIKDSHPAMILDSDPNKRDRVKIILFQLGTMINQFKHSGLLPKNRIAIARADNEPRYIDSLKEKPEAFKSLTQDQQISFLLRMLIEIRNLIAHDTEQSHNDYPEELDVHFLWSFCQVLHSKRDELISAITTPVIAELPKEKNTEKDNSTFKKVMNPKAQEFKPRNKEHLPPLPEMTSPYQTGLTIYGSGQMNYAPVSDYYAQPPSSQEGKPRERTKKGSK